MCKYLEHASGIFLLVFLANACTAGVAPEFAAITDTDDNALQAKAMAYSNAKTSINLGAQDSTTAISKNELYEYCAEQFPKPPKPKIIDKILGILPEYSLADIPDISEEDNVQCLIQALVIYEDYLGWTGCSFAIMEACYHGWLLHNDDPLEPKALEPYLSLCNGCSDEQPCIFFLLAGEINEGRYDSRENLKGTSWPYYYELFQAKLWTAWFATNILDTWFKDVSTPTIRFVADGEQTKIEIWQKVCSSGCSGKIEKCSFCEGELCKEMEYIPVGDIASEMPSLSLSEAFGINPAEEFASLEKADSEWCSLGACLFYIGGHQELVISNTIHEHIATHSGK